MNNNDKYLLKSICKVCRIETEQEFRDLFCTLFNKPAAAVAPAKLHTYKHCRDFYNSHDIELWECIENYCDSFGYGNDVLTFIHTYGKWDSRHWSTSIETSGDFASKVVWIVLHILADQLDWFGNRSENVTEFVEQFLSVPESKEVAN